MKRSLSIALALFLAILLPLFACADLTVSYIDVGQGDAALVQCDGRNMLIDAGTNASTDALLSYLSDVGATSYDLVVGTHPHEDHIGGLDRVIEQYDVANVWMPRVQADTRTFEDVLLAIRDKGLKITSPVPGSRFKLGGATVTAFAPVGSAYEETNDYSIVLRIDYGSTSFLFTGDAEAVSEQEMLASGVNLKANVLKVGHHGSSSSTSDAFLDAVSPEYAVISCGKDNSYGHPHSATVSKLESHNIDILRTDESGTIWITSDGEHVTVDGIETGMAGYPNGKTNAKAVNVRSTPSTKGKKVISLDKGTVVEIVSETTGNDGKTWYQIKTPDGKDGYIRSDLLDDTNEEATKPEEKKEASGDKYIGNKNTKKFHRPSCGSLPAPKNQVYFDSRDYAISKGYDPCKKCNP